MGSWGERLKPWYESLVWLLYTVLGIAITAGAGGIAGAAASNDIKIADFTDGGQFAVYTAGVLIGTEYLLKKPERFRLPLSEFIGFFTLVGLLASGAFMILAGLIANDIDLNKEVYRWPSVGLFILAVFVSYAAVVADKKRISTDPRAPITNLSYAVDSLRKDEEL